MRFNKTNKIIFIIFIGFILYGNTFGGKFFWDDYDIVTNNQYIRSWQYFPRYFTENLVAGSKVVNNYWRPLQLVLVSLDYHLGGLNPFIYHLQNLFWHILATILLMVFIEVVRVKKNIAFFVSLFFLVHPLQTEVVSYVSGRMDSVLFVLTLGVLLLFIKSVRERKYTFYWFAFFMFILALFAKERSVVVFPLLTALIFTVLKNEINLKRKILLLSPFALLSVVYIWLRMTILHFSSFFIKIPQYDIGNLVWYKQLMVYLAVIGHYIEWIVFPVKLRMVYTVEITGSLLNWYFFIGLLAVCLMLYGGYKLWKKRDWLLMFWLAWLVVWFLPNFYTIRMQGCFAEHWLYSVFPAVFVFVGVGLGILIRQKRIEKKAVLSAMIILFGSYSFLTVQRNYLWHDPIAFYEENIKNGAKSVQMYNNLGLAYAKNSQDDKAEYYYNKAVQLNKNAYFAWFNLGNLAMRKEKNKKAIEYYQQAIRSNEYFLPAYHNLASILVKQNSYKQAIKILQQGLTHYPSNIELLYDLAIANYQNGNITTAKQYIEKILKINPNDKMALELLKAKN